MNTYVDTVPHELTPVTDLTTAERSFALVMEGSLPGFILDTSGVTRGLIEARFTPVAEEHNFFFRGIDEQVAIGTAGELGDNPEPNRSVVVLNNDEPDFYPHIDFSIDHDGPIVSCVNLHLTTRGAATFSLYELQPGYVSGNNGGLPYGKAKELRHNQTDPTVIKPHYQTAILRAGMMAVFRTGGHSPLIHDFQTIEVPRYAFVMRAIHRDGYDSIKRELP